MIPIPRGWSAHESVDELLLVHPAGLAAGAIRYRDRLRPLGRISELVAASLDSAARFEVDQVGPIRLATTHEGEYAALVTVSGSAAGEPAQHDFGFVIHDECYARVAALSVDPTRFAEMTELVTELVRADTFLRGAGPRRALYRPPAGWQGIARGLMTEWYPPEFPRAFALINVWPALPRESLPEGWWRSAWQPELGFAREGEPASIASAGGLEGEMLRVVRDAPDGRIERELALLGDERYVHLVRLETTGARAERDRAVFLELLRSMQPIPRPRSRAANGAAFEHWGA